MRDEVFVHNKYPSHRYCSGCHPVPSLVSYLYLITVVLGFILQLRHIFCIIIKFTLTKIIQSVLRH